MNSRANHHSAKRILVIDDERPIQRALEARLVSRGFSVECASDGVAGLALARARPPSVVLLDVRMPALNGFEVLRQFKADPALAEIPVVLMSANALDTTKHSAATAGGFRFMAKPYDSRELLELIAQATKSREIGGPMPNGAASGVTPMRAVDALML